MIATRTGILLMENLQPDCQPYEVVASWNILNQIHHFSLQVGIIQRNLWFFIPWDCNQVPWRESLNGLKAASLLPGCGGVAVCKCAYPTWIPIWPPWSSLPWRCWVGRGEAWFSLMIMLMIVIMMIREWWCDSSHDSNNDYRTNYYYSICDDCQYLSSVIHSSSIIHHPPFFIIIISSLICLISLSNCSFGAIRDPLRNHRLFAQLQVSDECLRRRIFLFGRHGPRSAAARHPEKKQAQ